MNKIDMEAHFLTEEYVKHLRTRKDFPKDEFNETVSRRWLTPDLPTRLGAALEDSLYELGSKRTA